MPSIENLTIDISTNIRYPKKVIIKNPGFFFENDIDMEEAERSDMIDIMFARIIHTVGEIKINGHPKESYRPYKDQPTTIYNEKGEAVFIIHKTMNWLGTLTIEFEKRDLT